VDCEYHNISFIAGKDMSQPCNKGKFELKKVLSCLLNMLNQQMDTMQVLSSQIYLYSAFHNTDCIKAASQYQLRQHNSVCLFMKRQSSLVELINGMMGHLIWIFQTEQAKGNSGKETEKHQVTRWCPKTPSNHPMEKKKPIVTNPS